MGQDGNMIGPHLACLTTTQHQIFGTLKMFKIACLTEKNLKWSLYGIKNLGLSLGNLFLVFKYTIQKMCEIKVSKTDKYIFVFLQKSFS